ncbi:MAG TPA: Nif3-like dinuclear metal center hexameric protein [Atribacteraceae bacterium]|nr:Nif3-like dinuclear metal center hexameric protein [Atribacteraceae bacterium]
MEELETLVTFFDSFCPPSLAFPEDPTGIHISGSGKPIGKVLAALELNPAVFQKTLALDAGFLFLHHPPLWEPLNRLSRKDLWTNMLCELYHRGVCVLAHHTNLDCQKPGMSEQWMEGLALAGPSSPLLPRTAAPEYTVVTFTPPGALDKIRDGAFKAGGGTIGRYRECSFSTPGTGTYTPQSGALPYRGNVGQRETIPEVRLEIHVDSSRLARVVTALHNAHPYENPVIDVYPLPPATPSLTGLGRLIHLTEAIDSETLFNRAQELFSHQCRLDAPYGEIPAVLRKIALCPGSGSSLLPAVLDSDPQIYLTGDLSHHQVEKLRLNGIFSLQVPHGPGERYAFRKIFHRIREQACREQLKAELVFEDEC